jgi:AcrR family transcriptional regulator
MWSCMNDRSDVRAVLPPGSSADGTRRRILESALRLFAVQGFHGASMRELAKLVEIQPSALYVHFPSKEHVLAELARVGHEAHHAALRAALLEAGSDPAQQLRSLVAANTRIHATYPHLAIVVNDEMRALSAELAGPALALRKQSLELLLDVLRRGVALGRFSVPRVEIVAAAIGAMGMRIPYWYSPALGIDVEELAAAQAELAARMVGAKG